MTAHELIAEKLKEEVQRLKSENNHLLKRVSDLETRISTMLPQRDPVLWRPIEYNMSEL